MEASKSGPTWENPVLSDDIKACATEYAVALRVCNWKVSVAFLIAIANCFYFTQLSLIFYQHCVQNVSFRYRKGSSAFQG